jgi:hypothetical protein
LLIIFSGTFGISFKFYLFIAKFMILLTDG